MGSYLPHLQSMYSKETFARKLAYIDYNIGSFLSRTKDATVLEIGPGLGELVAYIGQKRIGTVDIVDNDKTVLSYVKKTYLVRKTFLTSNVVTVEKKLDLYDAIVLIQVFEHMPPKAYTPIVQTLYAHLKLGGHIIMVVPNGGNPLGLVERYGDIQHYNSFTEASLRDVVSAAGLLEAHVSIRGYHIPPVSLINLIRILVQKILHIGLLLLLIANGGTFFGTMTPNIMLVISKPESKKHT